MSVSRPFSTRSSSSKTGFAHPRNFRWRFGVVTPKKHLLRQTRGARNDPISARTAANLPRLTCESTATLFFALPSSFVFSSPQSPPRQQLRLRPVRQFISEAMLGFTADSPSLFSGHNHAAPWHGTFQLRPFCRYSVLPAIAARFTSP